jgi:hypothetical protein
MDAPEKPSGSVDIVEGGKEQDIIEGTDREIGDISTDEFDLEAKVGGPGAGACQDVFVAIHSNNLLGSATFRLQRKKTLIAPQIEDRAAFERRRQTEAFELFC